jgi:hypothetical protein
LGEREDNEIPKTPLWLTWQGWLWALAFGAGMLAVKYLV